MDPIRLSKRQVGDADRVGGIELMILWPASLGPEPSDLPPDHDREASAEQKATAEQLVRESCRASGLVPVHVRIANVRRPKNCSRAGDYRVHLAVTIIGKRWVHASTQKRPRVAFAS